MIFYILRIWTRDNVSETLGVQPTNFKNGVWEYQLVQKEGDAKVDFVRIFLELLDGKLNALQEKGIEKEKISIWMLYEYKQECNILLSSEDMRRLSEKDFELCISCWQGDIDKKPN